jgi:hypothetical protein
MDQSGLGSWTGGTACECSSAHGTQGEGVSPYSAPLTVSSTRASSSSYTRGSRSEYSGDTWRWLVGWLVGFFCWIEAALCPQTPSGTASSTHPCSPHHKHHTCIEASSRAGSAPPKNGRQLPPCPRSQLMSQGWPRDWTLTHTLEGP